MKSFREFITEADSWTSPTPEEAERIMKKDAASGFDRQKEEQRRRNRAAREKFRDAHNRATGRSSGGSQRPPQPASSGGRFRIPRPTGGQAIAGLNIATAGYDVYAGTKERQARGERLRTALPKASAEAGGGLAAATAASALASKVLPKNPWINIPGSILAGTLGYWGGQTATSDLIKKLESPFGGGEDALRKANEKRGVQQSRQVASQAKTYGATKGSALTGLGGPTKVDTKAGTLTTKGKTVKLASTQLVRDPKTGQQRVGDLAYKGGKAVYIARASTASRDSYASPAGAWRNLQRGLNIGGQRERDIAAAKQEYRTALKNTQTYTRGLGISSQSATRQGLPGYGTKPAVKPAPKPAARPAGGGMGGRRGGGSNPSVK